MTMTTERRCICSPYMTAREFAGMWLAFWLPVLL